MRVLSTELTNALESGNYIPYYRVELGDGVHWYESREPISYRLDPLSMRVRFPISEPLGSGYAVSEIPYARLVRGVLIGETAYTISTSQFYITAANWDGDATIEASIVPVQKYTADGDVSYSSVISAFCSAYGFTAVFENPSADWWGYQFLPDGKQIILNDANRFFSLLRQKYLIFACDNGGNEIKFFHIASLFPTSMYTLPSASLQMADLFFEKRQYLWRDELGTIHNSGDPASPVHNLGYLPSTAIPPSVESDLGECKIVSPMHLKLQTGDTVSFVYRSGSLYFVVPIRWLNVVEELDHSKSLPWRCVLSPIDYFSNTEGGAMPSTIERVAAYTPLVSVNFDGNLTPAVNNLQALAEAVDDLPLAPATTAANDVQVGDGAGNWIKKTLAEFVTIIRTALDSVYLSVNGWTSSSATWSYSSLDSGGLTGVISVNADMTGLIGVGDRISYVQSSTTKYGIVTKVGSYSGGATLITFFYGNNTAFANAAITSPKYSHAKSPFGFPTDPAQWTVLVTDTTDRSQANPTAGTYYQPGGLTITVPIGVWKLGFIAVLSCSKANAQISMQILLSTTTNSITDGQLVGYQIGYGTTVVRTQQNVFRTITLASKTTYNVLVYTGTSGVTDISILPSSGATTKIYAECALL